MHFCTVQCRVLPLVRYKLKWCVNLHIKDWNQIIIKIIEETYTLFFHGVQFRNWIILYNIIFHIKKIWIIIIKIIEMHKKLYWTIAWRYANRIEKLHTYTPEHLHPRSSTIIPSSLKRDHPRKNSNVYRVYLGQWAKGKKMSFAPINVARCT